MLACLKHKLKQADNPSMTVTSYTHKNLYLLYIINKINTKKIYNIKHFLKFNRIYTTFFLRNHIIKSSDVLKVFCIRDFVYFMKYLFCNI